MQEKAFGGLKPPIQHKLHEMAEEFDRTGKIGSKPSTVTRPGTRIIREWQGKIHEVCALETGFEYRNQQYGSLSEIARQITGTLTWNVIPSWKRTRKVTTAELREGVA